MARGIRLPHAKRAARQRGIGIPAVARHLFPNPAGPLKGLPLVGKFDFSDDKPRVVPEELVDFPDKALIGDFIADLVDEGWQRQRVEHPVGVPARDLVLELGAIFIVSGLVPKILITFIFLIFFPFFSVNFYQTLLEI